MKTIVDKFNLFQKSLVLQSSDLSLESISAMVKKETIDIKPKYQRRDRWGAEKQSALIESFLMNIPIPPVYLAEDDDGTYSVIDGKQRITAIHKFFSNSLKLKGLERFSELEGMFFSELPDVLSNALKIRPYLRVVTLLQQSDPNVKHEVFIRLNKAGVALNSQEIRNVAYRGKFNDLLFDLAGNSYFKDRLNITEKSRKYSEMEDVRYVLRFFTVLEYWKNFQGNMDIAMDDFMQKYYVLDEAHLSKYRSKFNEAIETCEAIWGNEAFTKPSGSRRALQGYYDIQMVGVSLLDDSERTKLIDNCDQVKERLVNSITEDSEFEEAITQFTSNPERMKLRISRAVEVFRSI